MDINNEDFQKFLKWCDEQVKHFESLDKAENNSTRYWPGRVDSISACKIYVAALQPSPLPLIETGQDAIEFAEWIDDNFKNYEYRGKYSWSKKFPDQNTMIQVSTKSLYELFKTKKQ